MKAIAYNEFGEVRGGPPSLDSLAAGLRWIPQG
jgi:hypothetical protein